MANKDSFEKVYVLVLYTGGTIGMKETSQGKKVNSLSQGRCMVVVTVAPLLLFCGPTYNVYFMAFCYDCLTTSGQFLPIVRSFISQLLGH